MWGEGKGLHLRPVAPELHDALRMLAKAQGLSFYAYVHGILEAHVAQAQPHPVTRPRAEVTSV